ncbi:MAG TPA: PD-(D/E)XK nuclease family protein [Opitutus sp.]|nr:PD-(D/E)XK nuclease family protein [Opitutus sp.]
MVAPPENVRRHFLPWDSPLLPQAVAWLAGAWQGAGPLDLGDTLVVVPTRQSGRRLREALAEHAAKHGQAAFPPRVTTPEGLLTLEPPAGAASRLEALVAWTEVLRAADLDEFRELFPVDPPERSFAWARRLARQLLRLQATLAEAGLRLGGVAAAGGDFVEAERWEQLGELEARYDARLASAGRRDPRAAEFAAIKQLAPPAGIARVVMLAAPDPLPQALAALAALARRVPVEVIVYAPPGEADAFDGWGRPRVDAWATRALALPDWAAQVHVCADPAAQAQRVAALARAYREPEGVLGIGVADAEILPLLEAEFAHNGHAAFNPEGRPRAGEAFHQLLAALAALAREDSFATVAALARCPDLLEHLRGRLGTRFSAARFLAELDALHQRSLPPTLGEARRQAAETGLAPALAVIDDLRARVRGGGFPGNAAAVLREIFAHRRLDPAQPHEARLADAAETWAESMRGVAALQREFRGLDAAEGWDLALELFAESVRYEDKPAGAVELSGWLELLWEDAPHLVVAGVNDGRVPDAIVGDAFLPESLRERLGLKTNAARLARDAYILQAIAAARAGRERAALDLLVGRTSAAGEPLRPSRLLLRCADAELPARVGLLFRAVAEAGAAPAWRRAWTLRPRRAAPPARVAVTGLRRWLECPLRFYFSRVLKMEAVDAEKTELDRFDFGTLCHAALEAMGRDDAARASTDAAMLRDFLVARVEAEARRRFGAELTLPLLVQLESARQRLTHAAAVQAEARADGWVIEDVERPFEIDVGGLAVRGKIDRIDRHADGRVRVLDYKTSDRPVEPADAHVRAARRGGETAPEFARCELDGKPRVWTDLQLPLYVRALAATGIDAGRSAGPGPVECGYFNLPKAVGETGIRVWTDYTRELDAAAWRCALGVAAAIRAGEFWPPAEWKGREAERDDFAALFHRGAAASVEWEPTMAGTTPAPPRGVA